ncbi:MAG: dihydropyrimidinase [Chloroflexi bacterium]|nr:MAG: dihydropyrimidinase [Chloroflexota bacterium]
MTYDLVIQNGTIVTATTTYKADVGITGERIAAIGERLSGKQVVDATGKLVTPGAVDVHVHLALDLGPGLVSSDDFFTGTRAAAFGGTTTVISFVHPEPDESMMAALMRRRAEADPDVVIDYAFHSNIGPHHIDRLDELKAVAAAGITTYKLYMAYGLRLDDAQLLLALEAIGDVGGLPVVHAENWDVIQTLVARNVAAGRLTPHWHPRSRPALTEAESVSRVIDLATYVGVPVHIFHVGCSASVERIVAARARGLPVTGETCPQYLFLTDAAYDQPGLEGTFPVCAPPLRPEADRLAMWDALKRDALQIVTTDHAPFTSEQKSRGLHDFSKIPGGVPSIEMRFAAVYSGGVREGYFSLNRWVDVCCTTPATLCHLDRKGHIAVGYDADLVIFDTEKTVTLSTDTLHEHCDWTPYAGLTIHGWPQTTISRGRVIVHDGAFFGERGQGRFIERSL